MKGSVISSNRCVFRHRYGLKWWSVDPQIYCQNLIFSILIVTIIPLDGDCYTTYKKHYHCTTNNKQSNTSTLNNGHGSITLRELNRKSKAPKSRINSYRSASVPVNQTIHLYYECDINHDSKPSTNNSYRLSGTTPTTQCQSAEIGYKFHNSGHPCT